MAEKFAAAFYHSDLWKRTRRAYREKVGGLCEECLAKGIIRAGTQVHHVHRLTPENISDPKITVNFDNLQLLCEDCHQKKRENRQRWRVRKDGTVVI